MARVVITGGAGFIGSHLCDRFLAEGDDVIAIDNFITGSAENIENLFGNPHFKFMFYDITNYTHVTGEVDYVLHFASPASPMAYMKYPIQTLKVGALGTHKMLGLAKEKGARFLLASTSEIYGDPLVHPQNEEYWGNVNPIGVRGVYDEAKRYAEAITMAYYRYHGVQTRIARIFNTYGPRMQPDDGRAIPAFISQALKNEDVTVFGDGKQTRSVCYIDDLVEGIFRLLLSDIVEPINLGNPDEITILQLAQEIIELCKSKSKIAFKKLPEDDPKIRQPDITKAQDLLGWKPKIARKEGLLKTIEFFRARISKNVEYLV